MRGRNGCGTFPPGKLILIHVVSKCLKYTYVILVLILLSEYVSAQVSPVGSLRQRSPSTGNVNFNNIASPHNNTIGNQFDEDSSSTFELKGIEHHEEIPDSVLWKSVAIFRYYPKMVKLMEIGHPDNDPTGVQYSDKLDALNGNYYLSKGSAGHAHYGVYANFSKPFCYGLMPQIYDGYIKDHQSVDFYQTWHPLTQITYQSSLEKDHHVNFSHTQNVSERFNLAFDYDLIRSDGVYTQSKVKNHYLDVTSNYYSKDSRYQMLSSLILNHFLMAENGGVVDDVQCWETANRGGVPVVLYDGTTLFRDFSFMTHHTFNTVRQSVVIKPRHKKIIASEIDTVRLSDTVFVDGVTLVRDTLLFNVKDVVKDSIVRIDTFLLADPKCFNTGVWGFEMNYDRMSWKFSANDNDGSLWSSLKTSLYWTNDAYMAHRWVNPFVVKVGAEPIAVSAMLPDMSVVKASSISPFAGFEWYFKRNLLSVSAQYSNSMWNHSEYLYRYVAQLAMPIDSSGHHVLSFGAFAQYDEKEYIYQYLNELNGGSIRLNPITTYKFSGRYDWDDCINVELAANNVRNNVWMNADRDVIQSVGEAWLMQANITCRYSRKWFHLDMQQLIQYSSDQYQIPVPLWASKNSVYADFNLFQGALRAQIGFDIRYLTGFKADAYDPYTSMFFRQSDVEVGDYFWGDVFVNLQIKRATLYAKVGHVNALWESGNNPSYFLLPHYPGRDFGIFYGLIWKFYD